ncbi:MAG: ABC transporter substrate-binding protein [Flavobacteriaceae bacterium]|nr:ABC transporter substrate-binding protein [Flavobacteriaceae bacterium]
MKKKFLDYNGILVSKNLLLKCILLLLLISCKKQSKNFTDDQVFRYNEHSNITSLDPAFAKNQANIWPCNQLFNGLVQLDDALKIQPDIAKKWNFSEDGKTINFTLRNDVYFHKHKLFGLDSTRTVRAQDFEYSFNRLISTEVVAPGKWVLNNVSSFRALNDSVFQLKLKEAFPPFLGLLTMKYCAVVPQEIVEYYGSEFRSNPIGTGPFYFKLWVENTKLVLRKNEYYYEKEKGEKLPYLEAISITFLPDKQSEFLQLIQGNLDMLSGIDASFKDDILKRDGQLNPKYGQQIKMLSKPYLNTEYLGFFMENSKYPTANINLRKAINYGFDRKKMIRFLRNGIGTPAIHGFIPKGLPSFNHLKGFDYQPKLAKEYLDKYSKETGNESPLVTITTNAQYLDLCEFIQQEMSNLGITIKIDVVPGTVLKELKKKGEAPIFRASWIADYPDAENYLMLFYSKNFTPNGANYTHFKNEVFDSLYEQSIATVTAKKRHKLYQKMDSILVVNAPMIPLYYDEVTVFIQKNVTNFTINAINSLNLKRVKKTIP